MGNVADITEVAFLARQKLDHGPQLSQLAWRHRAETMSEISKLEGWVKFQGDKVLYNCMILLIADGLQFEIPNRVKQNWSKGHSLGLPYRLLTYLDRLVYEGYLHSLTAPRCKSIQSQHVYSATAKLRRLVPELMGND